MECLCQTLEVGIPLHALHHCTVRVLDFPSPSVPSSCPARAEGQPTALCHGVGALKSGCFDGEGFSGETAVGGKVGSQEAKGEGRAKGEGEGRGGESSSFSVFSEKAPKHFLCPTQKQYAKHLLLPTAVRLYYY